jgi:putative inorganic carbon (hco3(-)) transporter
MRDLVFSLFMLGLVPFALSRPNWAILIYAVISVMNPHRLMWGFAYDLPWAVIFGAIMAISVFIKRNDQIFISFGIYKIPLLFVGWTVLTTFFALDNTVSEPKLLEFIKIQISIFVTLVCLRTGKEVTQLLLALVLSLGFYAVKGSFWVVATLGAYRLQGPKESPIQDENSLAVAVLMVVPVALWLYQIAKPRWLKIILAITVGGCVVATLGTQSRGGFLTLMFVSFAYAMRTNKKLLMGSGLAISVIVGLSIMPEKYWARLQTIGEYSSDESSVGRLNAWTAAFNLANDKLTGGGFVFNQNPLIFQQYAPPNSTVLTAHSIYFQTLGEHGWIGLSLFLLMFITILVRLQIHIGRASRLANIPRLELLRALQVSLMSFLLGGAFLSLAYWEFLYYMFAITLFVLKHDSLTFSLTDDHPPKVSTIQPIDPKSSDLKGQRLKPRSFTKVLR